MYIFKRTKDPNNQFDISEITHTVLTNEADIDEMLEHFKCFLAGCGFIVDGEFIYERNDD